MIAEPGSEIIGSDGADTIWAFNAYGDYAIYGGGGDDTLYGGRQTGHDGYADFIVGGPGADKIYGLGGDDDIVGGDGADAIDAGDGADIVYLIEPTQHIDVYLNTAAPLGAVRVDNAELILLGDYGAFVQGGAGVDAVLGGEGEDEVHGGGGDDLIAGLGGDDKLYGGEGDDLFDGGEGTDGIDLSASYGEITVDLSLVVSQHSGQGFDRFVGIENLYGGLYADDLRGDGRNNELVGGEGDDQLSGAAGDDVLDGGVGADLLDGGIGADRMTGGAGDDTYVVDATGDMVVEYEGEGRDTVRSRIDYQLGAALEVLVLDGAAKEGRGNERANTLIGNASANALYGGGGADVLDGGAGADLLVGGMGADSLKGGGGRDIFRGALAELRDDVIVDLRPGDVLNITDLGPANLANYTRTATGVVFSDGSKITLGGPAGGLVMTADGNGGVNLTAETHTAILGDFNGDGRTDLVWRFDRNVYVNGGVDMSWQIESTGDFNGDGKEDLLWRDQSSGVFSIWTSTGAGFALNALVDGSVSSGWQLASTAYDII